MAAIEVNGLRKSFGSVVAVNDVSFAVEPGECVALLGPNGAGKTTTVEILEGYMSRDAGDVRVLGADPQHGDRRWRERVGIVLQEAGIDPMLTVRDVLQRNANYYPNPRDVDEVIGMVELTEKADSRVAKMSGGQKRRLDVALGIIGRPELLFLDEPTTGFDPSARRGAWSLVGELRKLGTTIVLTTHYMDEAQALADRIIVLTGGQVVATGTPDDLGGRNNAAMVIRFRLPDGVDPDVLPLPAQRAAHGWIEITSTDEVHDLHILTGWSMKNRIDLDSLTAIRPSLEDAYLSLVGAEITPAPITQGASA